MNNSMTMGRRSIAIVVATATILWAVGFAAFVAPLTAQAASAGDLVKGTTLSTVYYYAGDGNRYAFPNEKSYLSWYSDFSGVVTMTDSELAAIPLGGNVVYRAGSRWVKIQSDPKTYAVTPNGQIRWIESQEVAEGLAGANWNTMIDDVPDVFFVDYTVGSSLTDASAGYNGALVASGGSNYLIWNGEKRVVSDAGFAANRFQNRFVLAGTGVSLDGLTAGSEIASAVSELTDTAQQGGVAVVTGGLTVSVASDTPAGTTLPRLARGVEFLKLKLTANSGSANVDQVNVYLGGIGATTNFDAVYLYDGSTRLTNARTVNSTTRMATFSGLNINLSAGETKYVSVKGDIDTAAAAGATAVFQVKSAADVSSTATVNGTFPASGNTMSFASTAVGEVTVSKEGSISNPTIGQEGATVGRFKIETSSTEDSSLHAVTLNLNDAKDHTNFELYKNADLIATGVNTSSDLVVFTLTNPLAMDAGSTTHFKVRADIGGQTSDNVQIAIEEDADVLAVGATYGFNMYVDIGDNSGDAGTYNAEGSACASSSNNCSFSTIQGGELTFAFNGPTSGNIMVDGKDVTLYRFTLTSQNWTEVKDLPVLIESTLEAGSTCAASSADATGLIYSSSYGNLSDLNIRDAVSGKVWMGPLDLELSTETGDSDGTADDDTAISGDVDDCAQILSFTDDQVLLAGESLDLIITADVYSLASANDSFRATLDMSAVSAEDANGDALTAGTDIVPGSNLVGNAFVTVASSIAVSGSRPPSGGTYVKGQSGVSVVAYAFTAGEASEISVTDLTITVKGYNNTATFAGGTEVTESDKINSCSLYDNQTGAMVDGPESITSSDTILFENFRWTVAAGETDKVLVKCNFANVAPSDTSAVATDLSSGGDEYAFYIAAVGDVTAEDSDGDSKAPSTISSNNNAAAISQVIIANSGTITVAVDGATPKATIVLGDSTNVEVARYKFTSTNESFTVSEITLMNCDSLTTAGVAATCQSSDTADDRAVASVIIQYTNAAGETVTQSGSFSGQTTQFDGMTMHVPSTGSALLKVLVNTATVASATDASSGDTITIMLSGDSHEDLGTVEFTANGTASGSSLTETDIDAGIVMCDATLEACVGNTMTLRKSKPTISLASGSPSGAGIPGLAEVFRFNIAADSRGSIVVEELVFKVTSTDNAAGNWNRCDATTQLADDSKWALYDLDEASVELSTEDTDWAFYDNGTTDGTTVDTGVLDCDAALDIKWVLVDLVETTDDSVEIAAGTTKTFSLWVDTTGANSINDDSFRIDIDTEANVDADSTIDATTNAIQWNDTDDEATDLNGTSIKNLPVTGGTILY
ncbi:MAG: hypothetical protein ABIH21_03505 [Patescibacteria group bacterium]